MNGATDMRRRPIGDLLSSFVQESTTLVSQEIELARAEIGEQVSRAGQGAGLFGAAAVLALAGLGALTACAIAALALTMDTWVAALIVGGALLVLAGLVALMGRARIKAVAPPVPERALQGVRRDIEAVQEGVQTGRASNGERESNGT